MTPGPATRILSPSAYVAWESEEPELSEQGGRVAPEEKRCEGEDNHLPNSAANAVDPLLSFFVWLHAQRRCARDQVRHGLRGADGSERVTRRCAVASLVVHGRDEHAGVLKRHQHSIPLFQC